MVMLDLSCFGLRELLKRHFISLKNIGLFPLRVLLLLLNYLFIYFGG
jgi:hypothetical protein